MNLSFLNSLSYIAACFWCVFFGMHGHAVLATIGTVFFITVQLYCTKIKNIGLYIQDLLLAFFSIPLGALLEMFFIQINVIHYTDNTEILPPIWIISLYPLLPFLLNHFLKTLKKNYLARLLFGFLLVPSIYMVGIFLKIVTIRYSIIESWGIIGISWCLFLYVLTKLANSIEKAVNETLEERDSKTKLQLLYDGACPLCNQEICLLQKKDIHRTIEFIDISSKDFLSFKNDKIDYKTAMSQIHAIDSTGTILTGVAAFAPVYARCELLIISTLLRIPFIEKLLKPLYRVFAKNRLWITGKMHTKQKKLWISFALFISLCLIVEVVGSFWTKETVSTWYPTLLKPSWTPPDSVFGPLWACLYMMIAISGWFIYKAKYSNKRTLALILYGSQLCLNFIWPFLFFSLRSPISGLIDIILLCLALLLTIIKAWPVRRLASLLLIPYFLWVLYAASLNAGIWILNRFQ